jgi:hypothetical protein
MKNEKPNRKERLPSPPKQETRSGKQKYVKKKQGKRQQLVFKLSVSILMSTAEAQSELVGDSICISCASLIIISTPCVGRERIMSSTVSFQCSLRIGFHCVIYSDRVSGD